jgi:selenide,water dikinase
MCRASGVGAEIDAGRVPVLSDAVFELIEKDCIPGGSRENLKTANQITEWHGASVAQKVLLADAQTSGGLLLCVRPRLLSEVLNVLKKDRTLCPEVIGRIISATKPKIFVVSNQH